MDSKKWYLSKSIWTGIVAVILAAYSTAAGQFNWPVVPEWVFGVLGSFGIYTRTVTNTTIK